MPPTNFDFGTVLVGPNSGDADPLSVEPGDWTATFDTTDDGTLIVHVFNFRIPDDGGDNGNTSGGNTSGGNNTGGNTSGGNNSGGGNGGGDNGGDGSDNGENSGGTGSGWVHIYTVYCLTDSDYTEIIPGAPGDQLDPYSFGDDSCIPDSNEYQITEYSRDDMEPFSVDYLGEAELELPSTAGDNPHLITDTWSGTTEAFDIADGVTTDVVVLIWENGGYGEEDYSDDGSDYYSEDYVDDYSEDDEYSDAEEAVTEGADLPDTGTGTISNSDALLIALLGLGGLALVGGAYQVRRGSQL
jgi:hypothetical protein